MTTFYDINCNEHSNILPVEESRHALKSLRLRVNERFNVINGKGLELNAIMKEDAEGHVKYEVLSIKNHKKINPLLHIAISPLKQPDRLEYFVEKATELGVNEISVIKCHRTEKPRIKEERINRILISAMKQSGNPFLPVINPIRDLDDFISDNDSTLKLIAHCIDKGKRSLSSLDLKQDTTVVIGPEGDFTDDEVQLAIKKGYLPITLGDLTLRTETAALATCAYFQMNNHK